MLLIWPLFAWLYFRRAGRSAASVSAREALHLSFFWLLGAVVVDFVGFVVIKNPWSLSPRQFYVDYQPWITLIYAAIFASPWIYLLVARSATPRSRPNGSL